MEPDAASGNGGCFDGTVPASSNFASCMAPVHMKQKRVQKQQQKIKPGSRFPLLYFMVLMSVATALVLVYRRVAFFITRKQLHGSVRNSSKPYFPGTGRKLCD